MRIKPWLRTNGVDLALAVLLGVFGMVFVRLGVVAEKGSPEQTVYLAFAVAAAGGLCAVIARILRAPLRAQSETRTERIKAAQHLIQSARLVREAALKVWRNRDNPGPPTGYSPRGRLSQALIDLRNEAFKEDVWIGVDGVDAVRVFNAEIEALDFSALESEDDVRAAVNVRLDALRSALLP